MTVITVVRPIRVTIFSITFHLLLPIYILVHDLCCVSSASHFRVFIVTWLPPLRKDWYYCINKCGFIKEVKFGWLSIGDRFQLNIPSSVQLGSHACPAVFSSCHSQTCYLHLSSLTCLLNILLSFLTLNFHSYCSLGLLRNPTYSLVLN